MRLYRNRQGLTKGKKHEKGKGKGAKRTKHPTDPNHRTRPELAVELIEHSPSSSSGGKSLLAATAPTVAKASCSTYRRTSI